MNTNFSNINIGKLIKNAEILNKTNEGEIENISFHVELDPPFLDVFDDFSFLVSNNADGYIMDETNNIKVLNAKFSAESILLQEEEMAKVVNLIMNMCDENNDYWTEVDYMRILSGVWRGRINLDYNVFITLDKEENFTLEFIDFNDFLKKTAST
ncbi:hypothetical protein KUL156_59660 [Alteromonas sp. KUL156]|nr:hypothetical protein KUL154_50840 [Alteromonas sp. KUL154]GFE03374.1 hypothetical protein KUL156_59660 [Alteromonas sp. KUL156]